MKRHETSPRTPLRRTPRSRNSKTVIIAVVEGKSEEAYLKVVINKNLAYSNRFHVKFDPERDKSHQKIGTDLNSLLKNAEEVSVNDDSFIIVVADADTIKEEKTRERACTWQENYPQHILILTHPCLEHWIYLHYAEKYVSAHNSKQILDLLENLMKKKRLNYKKGNCPPDISTHISQAIKLARVAELGTIPGEGETHFPHLFAKLDEMKSS